MNIVNFSEARQNLKNVMDRVTRDKTEIVVTRQKAEPVVMLSLSMWNAMEETLHLLSTPANTDRLRTAIGQLNAGDGTGHELADDDGGQ